MTTVDELRDIRKLNNIIINLTTDDEVRREEEQLIKHYKEEIRNYQKRIDEKIIILNYLLTHLIQLRELKADTNVIKHLEKEFERIRLERERAEEMVIKFKEHIRFLQN